MMLTIFSVPKPFTGHIGVIQRNAIRSWVQLTPACEIMLFGDESGTAEIAAEFNLRHFPEFVRNEYGTPLLDSIFKTAEQQAANSLLAYINTDIILMNDILEAARRISFERFLMIGQRWDLDVSRLIDYEDPGWETALRQMVREKGRLHPPSGVDYYLFPKGVFGKLPPFAIGRTTYDNWFIYKVRSQGIPVIDTTDFVMNIHQNHERTYESVGLAAPEGQNDLTKGIEAERNLALGGGPAQIYTLLDADIKLTEKGLEKQPFLRAWWRYISTLPERSVHNNNPFIAIMKFLVLKARTLSARLSQ